MLLAKKPTTLQLLLTILFALPTALTAQIEYTDLQPDSTVQATLSTQLAWFNADLNDDGITDVEIRHFYPDVENAAVELHPKNGTEVMVPANSQQVKYPSSISTNSPIGPNENWAGTATTFYLNNEAGAKGLWVGVQNKSLGLRLKISGQWHYGWIRLDVPEEADFFVVKDYAYNATSDTEIKAGEGAVSTQKPVLDYGIRITCWNNVLQIMDSKRTGTRKELTIVDLGGNTIKELSFHSENQTIDLTGVSRGIYLVRVRLDGDKERKEKIILH